MANSEYEYVKREFEFDRRLPPSNWIVVRIDGCHFHRYTSSLLCLLWFSLVRPQHSNKLCTASYRHVLLVVKQLDWPCGHANCASGFAGSVSIVIARNLELFSFVCYPLISFFSFIGSQRFTLLRNRTMRML